MGVATGYAIAAAMFFPVFTWISARAIGGSVRAFAGALSGVVQASVVMVGCVLAAGCCSWRRAAGRRSASRARPGRSRRLHRVLRLARARAARGAGSAPPAPAPEERPRGGRARRCGPVTSADPGGADPHLSMIAMVSDEAMYRVSRSTLAAQLEPSSVQWLPVNPDEMGWTAARG